MFLFIIGLIFSLIFFSIKSVILATLVVMLAKWIFKKVFEPHKK